MVYQRVEGAHGLVLRFKMDKNSSWRKFELTPKEVAFFNGDMGGGFLFGVENPFEEMEIEDVQSEMEEVAKSLIKKGIASISGEELVINDTLLELALMGLMLPDLTLIITRAERNKVCTKIFNA